MSYVYSRTEQVGKVTIVYTHYAFFYYALLATLVASIFWANEGWVVYVYLVFSLMIFVHLLGYWRVSREVRRAMKSGKEVSISGSKLSFKTPLTFVIKEKKD